MMVVPQASGIQTRVSTNFSVSNVSWEPVYEIVLNKRYPVLAKKNQKKSEPSRKNKK